MPTNYDFFEIDENNLIEEWKKQPRFYVIYADKLAKANRELERAKVALDVAEAELNKKIRANPAKFCGEDTRDAAIKAEVTIRLAKHAATGNFQDAKYKKDMLTSAVIGLDHRKRALQDIVVLRGQRWNAEPVAKGEDGQEGIKRIMQAKQSRRSRGKK